MKKTLQECKKIIAEEYRLLKIENYQLSTELLTDLANKMYFEQSEWVRVEDSLPENNKPVMGLIQHPSGRYSHCVVQYTKGFDIDVEDWDSDGDYNHKENDETNYLKEGWYEDCEQHQGMYDNIYLKRQISHWMPLPSPPKQ